MENYEQDTEVKQEDYWDADQEQSELPDMDVPETDNDFKEEEQTLVTNDGKSKMN